MNSLNADAFGIRGENMATKRKTRRKEKEETFFDYSLLFIVLFLLGFGLIMIYSASSYTAFQENGDAGHYMKKQLIAALIGLGLMGIVSRIPYHFFERFYVIGYVVSALLIPVVKTPLGVASHGARRWIRIPGLGMNLQPAEVAKLGMILFLAVMVCKFGKAIRTWKGIILFMAFSLPIALEIYLITNNMSSAIIIVGIAAVMTFVASPDYGKFILVGALGALGVALIVFLAVNSEAGSGFRMERIAAWLDPESYAQGKGFQTLQALYAIGSGGVWGKGLGQSMQKLSFLPEAQNDMIFSIICEELGLFGGICVILLFIMLLWRMMVIANNAPDLFGAMLVVGVMGHIAIQAVLNIAVVTNSIPNTGISLPFISYGGSSVMFLLIEIGLVMSVANGIRLKDL